MITLNIGNGHTGDLVVALPVAQGLLDNGHDVEVVMPHNYYEPMRWCKLPLVTHPSKGSKPIKPLELRNRHRTYDWLSACKRIKLNVDVARFKLKVEPDTTHLFNGGWALIQPWCENPAKQWDMDGWQLVVDTLRSGDMKVAVAGPKQFYGKAKALEGALNICGLDGKDWARTVAAADIVVTVDSGAGHVADALGITTVVLFGSNEHTKWAPFWDSRYIVKAKSMKDLSHANVVHTINRALDHAY